MRELFSGNSTKEHIKYVSQLNNNSNLFGVFYNNKALPDLNKYPYTNIRDDVTERIYIFEEYSGVTELRSKEIIQNRVFR